MLVTVAVPRLGPTELPPPMRPAVPAADHGNDSLFVARAALRRAAGVSEACALQVDQLRTLVSRLERDDREKQGKH